MVISRLASGGYRRTAQHGDLTGPAFDTLGDVWAFGDTALAIGTHGEADAFQECNRRYGDDCGDRWGIQSAYRAAGGERWKRAYALEAVGGEEPRLRFARGGPAIEPWRDRVLAIGLDGASPLALHASTDGLDWQRLRPRDQFPDMGRGFIHMFFVDGDLAIVSGSVDPVGDDSELEFRYFMHVGTLTP
jgi:hypothetical protein